MMMKLHFDKNSFRVLMNNVHERTGYRVDVLEKDYYVVLILEELAEKQKNGLKAYFKGGTALYKALGKTNRFSEDIDISVDTRDCSRTQNDKRLEQATKKYTVLPRNTDAGKTNRSEVVAVYNYEPISDYAADDALQRFGNVKIEAVSFTISEPTMALPVAAMIYDCATDYEKEILRNEYEVEAFNIQTMTLERIFVDKLFAAEAYARKSNEPHKAFEAAKHIYDLAVMANEPNIRKLFSDEIMLKKLLDIRLQEEKNRLDGIPDVLPNDFSFFTEIQTNDSVKQAYTIMQKQYVLQELSRIDYSHVVEALCDINTKLRMNSAWIEIGCLAK